MLIKEGLEMENFKNYRMNATVLKQMRLNDFEVVMLCSHNKVEDKTSLDFI